MIAAPFLAALMLGIAVSDWRRFRVPDPLILAALTLRGLPLLSSQTPAADLATSAARAAAMAALFYGFRLAYRTWRGRDGLGLGDVKLAAVAGAWVDWRLLPFVVEFAALTVLAIAIVRAICSGATLSTQTKLPFAVGFAPAIFVGWQLQLLGL